MGVNESLIFGNYFKLLAELSRLFEQLSADTVRPPERHLSFWCVSSVFCFFQVKGSQCSKSPRRCSSSRLLLQCKFPMLPFQCYANANILIAPRRFSTTRQSFFFVYIQFIIATIYHRVGPEIPFDIFFIYFFSYIYCCCWFLLNQPSASLRPPRDLDSKACVTIGEKVTSCPASPYLDQSLFILTCALHSNPCHASWISVSSLSSDCYITAECLLSWRCVSPWSRPTISQHTAVENASLSITSQSNISDCGENGMPFIALRAVKIFILKSSNKRNFPLAEFFFFLPVCSQTENRSSCDSDVIEAEGLHWWNLSSFKSSSQNPFRLVRVCQDHSASFQEKAQKWREVTPALWKVAAVESVSCQLSEKSRISQLATGCWRASSVSPPCLCQTQGSSSQSFRTFYSLRSVVELRGGDWLISSSLSKLSLVLICRLIAISPCLGCRISRWRPMTWSRSPSSAAARMAWWTKWGTSPVAWSWLWRWVTASSGWSAWKTWLAVLTSVLWMNDEPDMAKRGWDSACCKFPCRPIRAHWSRKNLILLCKNEEIKRSTCAMETRQSGDSDVKRLLQVIYST